MIEAINDYSGATILVSHDRHLLDACADRLWLVADGTVTPFDGDLDDYRRRVLSERDDERGAPAQDASARTTGAKRPAGRIDKKPLRERVNKAEAEMTRLTREIEKLDAALADGTLFSRDPAQAAAMAKSRAECADALAKAEEDWLAAGAALESAAE